MFKLWYGKIEGEYLHYVCHFLAGYMIAAIAIKNLGMADGIAVAVFPLQDAAGIVEDAEDLAATLRERLVEDAKLQ